MLEELKVTVNDRHYLLKRIYHQEFPLTYHIHFEHNNRPVVFRMRLATPTDWKIMPHVLPDYVKEDEAGLSDFIRQNES